MLVPLKDETDRRGVFRHLLQKIEELQVVYFAVQFVPLGRGAASTPSCFRLGVETSHEPIDRKREIRYFYTNPFINVTIPSMFYPKYTALLQHLPKVTMQMNCTRGWDRGNARHFWSCVTVHTPSCQLSAWHMKL
jgi:hypothetical protein